MNKRVITIGREAGSGGRTIGRLVAEQGNMKYYDREIIDQTAKESGLSAAFIEKSEQRITTSLLYNIAMGAGYGVNALTGKGNEVLSLDAQVYLAQQKVITELAERDACVIVGRCADYILRDRSDVLRCFIYANMEDRVERAVKEYGFDKENAEKSLLQVDKKRANHYQYFTEQTWGKHKYYDVMINSSAVGIERAAVLITEAASGAAGAH